MELDGLSIHLELPDLWQHQAVKALKAGRDVVLDAPTGAGKTYVFELFIKSGALKEQQAIYTVPTRALANDKWREWKAAGWKVGIATGDIAFDVDAPVVVATLETQRERFLSGQGPRLLVIDEYQMIGDPRRGLNYELGVALAPPTTQLLLLSGSVANPGEIADWMRRLGRTVELVQCKERPVPLEDVPVEGMPYMAPSSIKGFWPRLGIEVLLSDYAPLLIFAPQRKTAERIAQKIGEALPQGQPVPLSQAQEHALGPKLARLVRNRVAYHHSGLSYAQRAGVIEPMAKAGHLRVIVATTGLAAGINFSVRSVYIAETQYMEGPFQKELAPDELLQMFGRAGRRGKDDIGYVLSSESSPRLGDGRAKHLRRTNEIDWPTLLRVMKRAGDEGTSPFAAAAALSEKLFSRQNVSLGFEGEKPSPAHAQNASEGLFNLGPTRREVRNSSRGWERENPQATERVPLKDAIVYSNKRNGWRPAQENSQVMQEIALKWGKLAPLGDGRFGAASPVADIETDGRLILNRQWRDTLRLSRPRIETTFAELPALLAPGLRDGVQIHRLETRRNQIYAIFEFSAVEIEAYRDSLGAWLVNPPRRTLNLEFDTTYRDLASGHIHQPPSGSAAHSWRKLGLTDELGRPTQRGEIMSFFQNGEGLAVAAALEDETYPIEELVFHLANIRAGYRFGGDTMAEGPSQRLGATCRRTYGPVDYAGYLTLGLPPGFGEGAAEVIEARLHGTRRREVLEDLGEGDIERGLLEWLSLLRHIRNAPDADVPRWKELKAAARELLNRHGRDTSAVTNLPVFEPHVLHQAIEHRLSLRQVVPHRF